MKHLFTHDESLIKEVEIFEPFKGQMRALITAPEGATIEQLAGAKEALRKNGYTIRADSENGQHVLVVEHFGDKISLLANLANDNLVFGHYREEETELDHIEHRRTFFSNPFEDTSRWLEDNALSLTGIGYGIADGLGMLSGWMRNNPEMIAGAGFWMVPSVGLYEAGQQTTEFQMGLAFRDLKTMIQDNNVSVSFDVERIFEKDSADHGFLTKIAEVNSFDATNVNAVFQTLGGFSNAKGAIKEGNWYHLGAGISVILGMGGSLFVNERDQKIPATPNLGLNLSKYDNENMLADTELADTAKSIPHFSPDAIKDGNIFDYHADQKTEATLKQKVAGTGGMINNVLKLVSGTFHEKREHEEAIADYDKNLASVRDRASTAATNLVALENNPVYNKLDKDAISALGEAEKRTYESNQRTLSEAQKEYNESFNAAGNFDKNFKDIESRAAASSIDATAQVVYLLTNWGYQHVDDRLPDIDVRKLVTTTANMIVSRPEDEHHDMTQKLGVMMSNLKQIEYGADDMIMLLDQKVQDLKLNPWVEVPEPITISKTAQEKLQQEVAKPETNITEADHSSLERAFASPSAERDEPATVKKSENYISRLESENTQQLEHALH